MTRLDFWGPKQIPMKNVYLLIGLYHTEVIKVLSRPHPGLLRLRLLKKQKWALVRETKFLTFAFIIYR
jgi:hypothetical protein